MLKVVFVAQSGEALLRGFYSQDKAEKYVDEWNADYPECYIRAQVNLLVLTD